MFVAGVLAQMGSRHRENAVCPELFKQLRRAELGPGSSPSPLLSRR